MNSQMCRLKVKIFVVSENFKGDGKFESRCARCESFEWASGNMWDVGFPR